MNPFCEDQIIVHRATDLWRPSVTNNRSNFTPLGGVVARFDGGRISSDGGGLLLRETERLTGIIRQFSTCVTDYRDPSRTEHTVEELVSERVYAFAFRYEDLNDHDDLRHDPLGRYLLVEWRLRWEL